MRVLQVVTAGELGGAQVHVAALVADLVRAGVHVEVASGPGDYLAHELAGIAPVHLIPSLRSAPSPVADARSFLDLVRLTMGRDVVHTHSAKAGVLGRLAARVSRVPRIVHTSHGSFLGESRSAPAREILLGAERMAAAVTTHLFVLSRADLDLMRSFGLYRSTPVDVIRIAPQRVAHPRGTWSYVPGRAAVAAVANLYRNKGIDLLVRAMHLVARQVPGASLRVVGEGPERHALERLAIDQGVTVAFAGSLHDPTPSLLEAGVFVLPSRKEGLPIALLEALALGVPAVAARVGAVPEIILSDEALLVAPDDPQAIAAAVVRALTEPDLARALSAGGRVAAARFVRSAGAAPILAAYTEPN